MGLGLFWKECGPTSSEFLGHIKTQLIEKGMCPPGPLRKGIGHCGTLDPFAEGWLLVGWEEGTKFLSGLRGLTKTYEAEILIGATSDTFDVTHPLKFWGPPRALSESALRDFLAAKLGSHSQMPPDYSAKKIDGRPAYELARKGVAVDLKPAPVEVLSAEHLYLKPAVMDADDGPHSVLKWGVRIRVSAGTYIRAFARDWSTELWGEPACLSKLVRTAIGQFKVARAKQKIFNDIAELEPLFQVLHRDNLAELEIAQNMRTDAQAGRGALLLSAGGDIEATWVAESGKWRHFVSNPLR